MTGQHSADNKKLSKKLNTPVITYILVVACVILAIVAIAL